MCSNPFSRGFLALVLAGLSVAAVSGDSPTLEVLRKRFKGRVEIEKATGRVVLTYTFAKKDQLEDFSFSESAPKLQPRGGLLIAAGESIKHKALWEECRVGATLYPLNPQGTLARVGESIEIGLGKPTTASNKIQILENGKPLTQQTYKLKDFQNRAIPIDWAIDKRKSNLNFGGISLGGAFQNPIEESFAVELVASKGDMAVGALRISGKWDAEWLKKEFGEAQEKPGAKSPGSTDRP